MEDLQKLGEIGVFVINLRTRPERWELFQQRVLQPLELSVEVLRPEPHSVGRVGCFESHRALWHLTVERNLDCALIFEDDCALSASFTKELWKQALEEAALLPWDVFFLGYFAFFNCRQETMLTARLMAPHAVEFRPKETHSYLIRRAGCLKALEGATPDAIQDYDLDDFLTCQESLRILCTAPLLFQQGGGIVSDVDATRRGNQLPVSATRGQ
ncbi:glycosyltransferase family 25 protein, partial [bacterium]|nr:glycosyltransferase family 25 protein [bacterium]